MEMGMKYLVTNTCKRLVIKAVALIRINYNTLLLFTGDLNTQGPCSS